MWTSRGRPASATPPGTPPGENSRVTGATVILFRTVSWYSVDRDGMRAVQDILRSPVGALI